MEFPRGARFTPPKRPDRLIAMAQDYVAQADEIEAESMKAMPTIMGPSTSPDGETTEP